MKYLQERNVLALALNLLFMNNLYVPNPSLPLFSVVVKLIINRGTVEYYCSESAALKHDLKNSLNWGCVFF